MKHSKIIPVISFTYRLTVEKTGYSVRCLDWDLIYSQGETIAECKKNMIELTEHFLEELFLGKLHKKEYPQIKKHGSNILNFKMDFNLIEYKSVKKETAELFELEPAKIKTELRKHQIL